MRTQSTNKQIVQSAVNAGDQVTIGFSFASDWLREWREFPGPITQQRKAKLKRSLITFDTQLKVALLKKKLFMNCIRGHCSLHWFRKDLHQEGIK